jgi:hypothetical protein
MSVERSGIGILAKPVASSRESNLSTLEFVEFAKKEINSS